MKFAVQLYSLREMAQREGAEAVFQAVSEAGYDGVEFAGFYGKTPAEIGELLQKYRLTPVSAHIGAGEIEANLAYLDELGVKYAFIPWVGTETFRSADRYAQLLQEIKRAKALLDVRGIRFGYHNHAHEYENGADDIRKITDDAHLAAELDVFWATVAGKDAVAEMKRLSDRLALVHIKEAAETNPAGSPQPVVGEGAVDMKGVFAEAKRQNIPWAILEVESYPCPEREYLARSLENMKILSK